MGGQGIHERPHQVVRGEVEDEPECDGDGEGGQRLLEHGEQQEGQTQTLQDTEAGGAGGGDHRCGWGREHLVTAQGVGSGALTPQHLPWSSRQLCEVRGGRGSQPVPTPCTRVDEPASRPPELGRCYQTTSPGRVTCDV